MMGTPEIPILDAPGSPGTPVGGGASGCVTQGMADSLYILITHSAVCMFIVHACIISFV